MTMPPVQRGLVDRVRASIMDEPIQREVSMFGGLSFMVNEKMIVSVGKDGDLLVRVDGRDHDRLLKQPGATQAEMGPGRNMGPGWIMVASTSTKDDATLKFWIQTAMDHNRTAARIR